MEHLQQLVGLALGFDERERELQRHIVSTDTATRHIKVHRLSELMNAYTKAKRRRLYVTT